MSRTRQALRSAFVRLVLERRYDEIRIADILAEADVGKSTFYEHFRGKDELLAATMDPMLHSLSESAAEQCDMARLTGLVGHFWENRRLGRVVFGPPLVVNLRRLLAEMLERRWRESGALPLDRLASLQVAAGQLALLFSWVTGEVTADRAEIAAALRRTARPAGSVEDVAERQSPAAQSL